MLEDMFTVYGAVGAYELKPDVVKGMNLFEIDGEDYDYTDAEVVERDEQSGLVFREVHTLFRVHGDDEEWLYRTGYETERTATGGTWTTMDLYVATDFRGAEYLYLLRWEGGGRIYPYLIRNPSIWPSWSAS